MVRSLTAVGVAAGLTCLGLVAAPPKAGPSIGIFMDFDAPPAKLAVEAMKREVESIMKSTGLVMDWRSLKENQGREAFSGLVVVKFKGRCEAQRWNPSGDQPAGEATLGSSRVSEGRVLPFAEVECEQVRRTVPYGESSTCEQERQFALGRALGRVLAHELYHMLAKTREHAAQGLAKATQSFSDLAAGAPRFGQGDAAAIRAGVSPGVFPVR